MKSPETESSGQGSPRRTHKSIPKRFVAVLSRLFQTALERSVAAALVAVIGGLLAYWLSDTRAIRALVIQEPTLVGASSKTIRSSFDPDAAVCQSWEFLAGHPNSIWLGINEIIQRYQASVSDEFRVRPKHTDLNILKIRRDGNEKWALVETTGTDVRRPGKTIPELWVLHRSEGTWRIFRFYYGIPPRRQVEVLKQLRQESDL